MRDQIHAALWLSAMPVAIGVVMSGFGQIGSAGPLGVFGPLVALACAWIAFLAVALAAALALRATGQAGVALRTRVDCPACGASIPIIVTRCTVCREAIGIPAASRPTWAITMSAWGVFLLVLHLRPDRWLA
ncbi:MAG: hypothetical protein IT520_00430 [Burkholderiales bacterium]|nr:hypothetical protein [Burkholderiales bacterium]